MIFLKLNALNVYYISGLSHFLWNVLSFLFDEKTEKVKQPFEGTCPDAHTLTSFFRIIQKRKQERKEGGWERRGEKRKRKKGRRKEEANFVKHKHDLY